MIHSKAIDVLRTFTKEELKQFSDFVRSPFFNKNKNLIKLFDTLERNHPAFEIENEAVYLEVFPDKTYNHNNFKKLISDFKAVCEEYLKQVRFAKEKFHNSFFLLKELESRNLDSIMILFCKHFEDDLERNKDFVGFAHLQQLESFKIHFYSSRGANQIANNHASITESRHKRSLYNISTFLDDLATDLIDRNINEFTRNVSYSDETIMKITKAANIESVLTLIDTDNEDETIIFFLLLIILLFSDLSKECHFDNIKQFLNKHLNPNNESIYILRKYLSSLTDYCQIKVENGDRSFIVEAFEIYKLKFKLIDSYKSRQEAVDEDFIYSEMVRTSVMIALSLNEIKWADMFADKFNYYLPKHLQENNYHFTKARIEFERNNFADALDHAIWVCDRDEFMKFADHKILLKCFYELNLFEQALSKLDSCKHTLKNNKLLGQIITNNNCEYIKIYETLLKQKMKFHSGSNQTILAEIKTMLDKSKIEKSWFIKKFQELEHLYSKKANAADKGSLKSA